MRFKPKSSFETEKKRSAGIPGVGTYDLKSINNAYSKITSSSGRKRF